MIIGANQNGVADDVKVRARNAAKLVLSRAEGTEDRVAADSCTESKGGLEAATTESIPAPQRARARTHRVKTRVRRRGWHPVSFNWIVRWTKSLGPKLSERGRTGQRSLPDGESLIGSLPTRTAIDHVSQWCGRLRSGRKRLSKGDGER